MKPMSNERRGEILKILPKALPVSDGDGDWAQCYHEDVTELLEDAEYWRNAVKTARNAIWNAAIWCPFCMTTGTEHISEHAPDCAWKLAQE